MVNSCLEFHFVVRPLNMTIFAFLIFLHLSEMYVVQPPALLLFSSILNILSVLWRKFRAHTKVPKHYLD